MLSNLIFNLLNFFHFYYKFSYDGVFLFNAHFIVLNWFLFYILHMLIE